MSKYFEYKDVKVMIAHKLMEMDGKFMVINQTKVILPQTIIPLQIGMVWQKKMVTFYVLTFMKQLNQWKRYNIQTKTMF